MSTHLKAVFCSLLVILLLVHCSETRESTQSAQSARESQGKVYEETFDNGNGGWYADRHYSLPVWNGIAYCHGPWFLDANHAPPGAGYLHLVMWLYTNGAWYEKVKPGLLPYTNNSFVEQGFGRNFTDARMTVRLRGEVDAKGAELLLLVQSETDKTTANFVLTGQPFKVTSEWTEQTVSLTPDPAQWTCLGSRHDMTELYGCDEIGKVLSDVNIDIIFVLFPLKVVPLCEEIPDVHGPRAAADYPVDQEQLPKGLLMFDTVKIEFAN